jgi:5-methyltetrahydropteroyltriglutamate--homocysteine methyltransferase
VPADVLVLTHMCYGSVHGVYPKMFELPATVFCLELSHASPELLRVLREQPVPKGRAFGFGVVDVMDPRVESVDEIVGRIRTALDHVPAEQLWLNPDRGLQALAPEVVTAKMRNLVEAAARVRASLGEPETRRGAA